MIASRQDHIHVWEDIEPEKIMLRSGSLNLTIVGYDLWQRRQCTEPLCDKIESYKYERIIL